MVTPAGDFFAICWRGSFFSRTATEWWATREKRIGSDRRTRSRFEIVGTLSGTLETLQRLGVRNVGTGGALITASVAPPLGSRLTGRLAMNGQFLEIKAEVRHAGVRRARRDEDSHVIGIEWVDTAAAIADLLNGEPVKSRRESLRVGPERRRTPRVMPRDGAEINRPTWTTVELVDISTSGVLFFGADAMAIGQKGQLRMRLGDNGFAGQIEVRRVDMHTAPSKGYRIGAVFSALDEASRQTLEEFIGTGRH